MAERDTQLAALRGERQRADALLKERDSQLLAESPRGHEGGVGVANPGEVAPGRAGGCAWAARDEVHRSRACGCAGGCRGGQGLATAVCR